MKSTLIIFAIAIGFVFAGTTNAQTQVVFTKGTTEKTMTITVKPKDMNTYALNVKSGQVINVSVSGDIAISKTNEFPVIGLNLANGEEGTDEWQDGEGYLSVLTGRDGKFVVSINNSDRKRSRTFKIKFSVTNNREDYQGGTSTDQ
ncbi:MAG TPA: hypothetical protein PKA82_04795 [Pyrinomonadaceae bacterium]|nr:hypothetical protein [Pyrinomonadaceae bacterium]